MPAKAEAKVRKAVWDLSRDSAGMCVRFATDATAIHVRWKLTKKRLAMSQMPATGVSGVDLYVRHEGQWRWLAVGWPEFPVSSARLVAHLAKTQRQYLLYLPLYNGVSSVEIGVPSDAKIEKGKAPKHKPIVFYGTSITHGACASRPGMAHPAIVGRRLGYPIVNLGFSGNGRLETEVAELMAEVDAAVYILDCCPNLSGDEAGKRLGPCVRALRAKHPATPILVVEDRTYPSSFLVSHLRKRNSENRKSLRAAFDVLVTAGQKNLHYLRGEELLGVDGDDTVDGSHPTDLGFQRQAAAFLRVLRGILPR